MMPTNIENLRKLDATLRRRRNLTDLFERYYAGNHRLAYATEKFQDAFGSLFGAFADNWCGVIADTPNERLEVQGFQVGTDQPSEGDDSERAWRLWKDNDMEMQSSIVHLGAIKCGVSYVLVDTTGDDPNITAWPSSMAIVKHDPKSRKATLGATFWTDDDGYEGATLYTPDEFITYKAKDKSERGAEIDPTKREWSEVDVIPNERADGLLPLVEIVNRPNELGIGKSDLSDVLAMQDAINKLANDMLVASEFQAFRQRVLTGIEIPKNPETGEPLPSQQIEAAISRLWVFENPDAKVWDMAPADLGNYVSGIKELLNHVAAQTRTPPHYLIGAMVNVAGEALTAAESGLVSRVKAKQKSFARSWRTVIKLALDIDETIEVKWANPERQTLAAVADPVSKLSAPAIGLPREELWRMLGYSELDIARLSKSDIATKTAVTGATSTSAPDPTPPPPVPPTPPQP
jgi:Phage portal protein, SPP1 Gp6-like